MAALLIPPTRDPSLPPEEPKEEEEETFDGSGFGGVDFDGLAKANADLMSMMRGDPSLPSSTRRQMDMQDEERAERLRFERMSNAERDALAAKKAASAARRPSTRFPPARSRSIRSPLFGAAGMRQVSARSRPRTRKKNSRRSRSERKRRGRSRRRNR